MPLVKNLSKEDIPTRASDGSVISLDAGETKEMKDEYANKMLQVHGDEVIEIVGREKEKEKEPDEEKEPPKTVKQERKEKKGK